MSIAKLDFLLLLLRIYSLFLDAVRPRCTMHAIQ